MLASAKRLQYIDHGDAIPFAIDWLRRGLPQGLNIMNLPAVRETRVRSLGGEDPLEEDMATHSSIPAGKILRAEGVLGYSSLHHKESDTAETTAHATQSLGRDL